MPDAFFLTAAALAARHGDYPDEFIQAKHLVYSSPATLSFTAPGAEGFGVKRAGLTLPGSVMLLVAPACCGRNKAALADMRGADSYAERMYYLLLDDTDIVTGRYLKRIPESCEALVASLPQKPSAIMLCLTCVDALLGTDEPTVCTLSSERAGVPVVSCTMYALTREGRIPPMAAVRQTLYSLLKKRPKNARSMLLLGNFLPLADSSELYPLCRQQGIQTIHELARCENMEDYMAMAEANFSLVLHPEAELAAKDLAKRLAIPFIELTRVYEPAKIKKQYALLGKALGIQFDDTPYYESCLQSFANLKAKYGPLSFAIGENSDAEPFELALALLRLGFQVTEIFGTVSPAKDVLIQRIAELSPRTRIYSNLSPSMLFYRARPGEVDCSIGRDAHWYHPDCPGIDWCGKQIPFGYDACIQLVSQLEAVL